MYMHTDHRQSTQFLYIQVRHFTISKYTERHLVRSNYVLQISSYHLVSCTNSSRYQPLLQGRGNSKVLCHSGQPPSHC